MPQEHFAAKLRTRNCKPHTDHGRLNWLKPMEASQRQSGMPKPTGSVPCKQLGHLRRSSAWGPPRGWHSTVVRERGQNSTGPGNQSEPERVTKLLGCMASLSDGEQFLPMHYKKDRSNSQAASPSTIAWCWSSDARDPCQAPCRARTDGSRPRSARRAWPWSGRPGVAA